MYQITYNHNMYVICADWTAWSEVNAIGGCGKYILAIRSSLLLIVCRGEENSLLPCMLMRLGASGYTTYVPIQKGDYIIASGVYYHAHVCHIHPCLIQCVFIFMKGTTEAVV